MIPNPYQTPAEEGYEAQRSKRQKLRERRPKKWYGYFVAIVVGGLLGGGVLAGPLATLDDSGGLQLLIGGFLGVVIYHFLF